MIEEGEDTLIGDILSEAGEEGDSLTGDVGTEDEEQVVVDIRTEDEEEDTPTEAAAEGEGDSRTGAEAEVGEADMKTATCTLRGLPRGRQALT